VKSSPGGRHELRDDVERPRRVVRGVVARLSFVGEPEVVRPLDAKATPVWLHPGCFNKTADTARRTQPRREERQDRWADDRRRTVSWMSINRIDQYPGRGSASSCRVQKTPARVTAAAASQKITPAARIHRLDPDDTTIRPAIATASPT
jgi:hypothetical protein